MRAFLWFMAAIAGSLILAALLTYPLYLWLHPLQPAWRFDKIATRLFQVLALIAVIRVVRHLDLRSRHAWGYGARGPDWRRRCLHGVVAGWITMLPVSITMCALGIRSLLPELPIGTILSAVAAGLGSGLAVGFLEETFFRGLMQGAVTRDMRSPLVGVVLVAIVYSALHFLARVPIPHAAVTWHSGLDLLLGVAADWRSPQAILDSALALVAVGLLLGFTTLWSGNIAVAVGLHAGWVSMMRITIGLTTLHDESPMRWLVSRSDGYTGWLVLLWTLALMALAIATRKRMPLLSNTETVARRPYDRA